jgi:trans-aconitate 2-methyltransferase
VSTRPLEWDAATYDRVADPQQEWAAELIARLALHGDERVLDAGCGSGRVTRMLVERVPHGSVVAVDASAAMVQRARAKLGPEVEVDHQDLLELTLPEPVDIVFSNAVFHHIKDHDRLFERLRSVLRPGGRLVAQCGGDGNIAAFRRHADAIAARSPYSQHLEGMPAPWLYESPQRTEQRLHATGFDPARCWLQHKRTVLADTRAFARSVLLNYYLERLPASLHESFIDDVLAGVGEPLELDYVRLNIEATAA